MFRQPTCTPIPSGLNSNFNVAASHQASITIEYCQTARAVLRWRFLYEKNSPAIYLGTCIVRCAISPLSMQSFHTGCQLIGGSSRFS